MVLQVETLCKPANQHACEVRDLLQQAVQVCSYVCTRQLNIKCFIRASYVLFASLMTLWAMLCALQCRRCRTCVLMASPTFENLAGMEIKFLNLTTCYYTSTTCSTRQGRNLANSQEQEAGNMVSTTEITWWLHVA